MTGSTVTRRTGSVVAALTTLPLAALVLTATLPGLTVLPGLTLTALTLAALVLTATLPGLTVLPG
ncbi:hypothetical protein ABZV80_45915, partial [Streptomyces sp. NPDC005132]|uniref:hypothetical protein n=1 Tax=Streptomyces sp. NPDC005132 TaxID=3154294 RepID=UPI0033BAAD85